MIKLFLANLAYRWHEYRSRRPVHFVDLKLVNTQ